MIPNPLSLISFLFSGAIAFFTVALLVKIIFAIFKINNHRLRATLRLLPFFSLVIDILCNNFSIGNWLNPLSCDSCTQRVLLQMFSPSLKTYLATNEISLISHLASDSPQIISLSLFILFSSITIFFICRQLFQLFFLTRILRSTIQNGITCSRQIENLQLASVLQKNKTNIIVSAETKIPMAAYANTIIMPKKIVDEFSQEEFEAIIAHEFEHVYWKDPFSRLFLQFIAATFWWIPTHSWTRKIELDQEMACDRSILKYDADCESLASALVKVTKHARNNLSQALCCFTSKTNHAIARLQVMLGFSSLAQESLLGRHLIAVAVGCLFLLVCLIK